MDTRERLTDPDLERGDYLAASHLHRYALGAELCAGLRVLDLGCGTGYGSELIATRAARVHGVDEDAAAVAAAQRDRKGPALTFAAGDAADVLRRTTAEDHDVIVMFEALEHVPDPEAVLDQLVRLADGGTRLLVSVTNSRMFGERNHHRVTVFGHSQVTGAFARFADAVILRQVLAEGSLLLGEHASPDAFTGIVAAAERAEPEYAHAYVAVVGFGTEPSRHASARLALAAAPAHSRYMLELERANAELHATNRRLARGMYGKEDAAAAVFVRRHQEALDRIAALEQQAHEVEGALHQEWAWKNAARYRAADRAVAAVERVPGLSRLLRSRQRAIRGPGP